MPATQLALAHKQLQNHLQLAVASVIAAIWRSLGSYNQADVPRFLSQALPVVAAGQTQSAALTAAFIARSMHVPVFGIDPARVTGAAVRAGTPPETVYNRAFNQTWHDHGQGVPWQEAVNVGESRVKSSANMDVSLAQRASFQVAQDDVPGIYGYQRVPSASACEFCQSVAGAYVKSANAMPLHNNCGCSLEPLTSTHPNATWLPSGAHVSEGFAVHEHGELGAVLTDPSDQFTTESEARSLPGRNDGVRLQTSPGAAPFMALASDYPTAESVLRRVPRGPHPRTPARRPRRTAAAGPRSRAGAINPRNGVHAVAGVLAGAAHGGVNIPQAAKEVAAAKQVVGLYRNSLNEDPPDSVVKLAGS